MVVIAAGGDERGLVAVPEDDLESQHALVEGQRAVDVGDLEVDVADVHAGVERHASDIRALIPLDA